MDRRLRKFPTGRVRLAGVGLVLGLGIGAGAACADDTAPEPVSYVLLPPPWYGDVAAGYVRSGGNTDTSSLNLKLQLGYAGVTWANEFHASAYSGSRDAQTTDERYEIGDKLSYNFSARDYAFGSLSYDNDRFAGIAERYTAAIGYGRHVVATPTQALDLEAGLGANRSRDRDSPRFGNHGIATLGGKYVWKLTPGTQFSQTLRSEYASNNIYVNPVSELRLTVIGQLFAAIAFEIRYNSNIPAGLRHVDDITTLNLGYDFGKK